MSKGHKIEKLVKAIGQVYRDSHSFGMTQSQYIREVLKKAFMLKNMSIAEFIRIRWCEMATAYAERRTAGSGLIYELYEARRQRALKSVLEHSLNLPGAFRLTLVEKAQVSYDEEDLGWECEECHTKLSEYELAQSMSNYSEALCSCHMN